MLLNGGELDGARLLKAATIKQMTSNQIGDLKIYIPDHGDRIGYGFGVLTEAGKDHDVSSVGTYSWGGIFHTYFWIDPQKELIGVLMTQIYALDVMSQRGDFKKLVYDSLKSE
jgi:CubicO group peptidase (beta-lactamase class C family)